MTTNYDPIAEQYKRSKQQPWRTHIEAFTLLELVGDPTGLKAVDLACGEGFYSRLLRQRGGGQGRGRRSLAGDDRVGPPAGGRAWAGNRISGGRCQEPGARPKLRSGRGRLSVELCQRPRRVGGDVPRNRQQSQAGRAVHDGELQPGPRFSPRAVLSPPMVSRPARRTTIARARQSPGPFTSTTGRSRSRTITSTSPFTKPPSATPASATFAGTLHASPPGRTRIRRPVLAPLSRSPTGDVHRVREVRCPGVSPRRLRRSAGLLAANRFRGGCAGRASRAWPEILRTRC